MRRTIHLTNGNESPRAELSLSVNQFGTRHVSTIGICTPVTVASQRVIIKIWKFFFRATFYLPFATDLPILTSVVGCNVALVWGGKRSFKSAGSKRKLVQCFLPLIICRCSATIRRVSLSPPHILYYYHFFLCKIKLFWTKKKFCVFLISMPFGKYSDKNSAHKW